MEQTTHTTQRFSTEIYYVVKVDTKEQAEKIRNRSHIQDIKELSMGDMKFCFKIQQVRNDDLFDLVMQTNKQIEYIEQSFESVKICKVTFHEDGKEFLDLNSEEMQIADMILKMSNMAS